MELTRSDQGYVFTFGDIGPDGQVDATSISADRAMFCQALQQGIAKAEQSGMTVAQSVKDGPATLSANDALAFRTSTRYSTVWYIQQIAGYGANVLNRLPLQASHTAGQAIRPTYLAGHALTQAVKLRRQLRAMEQSDNT